MKRIKWLVIFALIACCLLFLCSTTHAYSDEEYNYISEMTTHSDNISAAVKEFADMITGITAQKLNDPNYVAKVVVAVATLDGIALQAKDIECPNSFKGSNLYYLQVPHVCISSFGCRCAPQTGKGLHCGPPPQARTTKMGRQKVVPMCL